MDEIPASSAGQLERVFPLLVFKRVDKLGQKCTSHTVRCIKLSVALNLSAIFTQPTELPLEDKSWPSREQVDPLEADFFGILASILEQQRVQLATHVVDGARRLRQDRVRQVEVLVGHEQLQQPAVQFGAGKDDLPVLLVELGQGVQVLQSTLPDQVV